MIRGPDEVRLDPYRFDVTQPAPSGQPIDAAFTVLFIAFGWGVVASARGNRALRNVGILIIANGFLGLYWPRCTCAGAKRA